MNFLKTVMIMAVCLFELSLITGVSQAVVSGDGEVEQAYSRQQHYSIPAQGSYECGILYDAMDVVLSAVDARNREFQCYYYQPARLSFRSLRKNFSHPEEPSIPAIWMSQRIILFRDGYSCADLANWIDWFLDRVEVRNIQSYVFCGGQGGSLQYQFDALVPFENLIPGPPKNTLGVPVFGFEPTQKLLPS